MRNPWGLGAFAALFALAAATQAASAAAIDDVRSATVDAIQAKTSVPRSTIHVRYVVVAGRWGFASWKIVRGLGGDMVLMKSDGVWHEYGQGSPHMSAHVLQRFGVPPQIILTFANGACPVPANSVASGYTVDSVSVRRYDGNGKQIDSTTPCR
jgi:hypothetical protein